MIKVPQQFRRDFRAIAERLRAGDKNGQRVNRSDTRQLAADMRAFVERWQERIDSPEMDRSLGELLEVAEEFEEVLSSSKC